MATDAPFASGAPPLSAYQAPAAATIAATAKTIFRFSVSPGPFVSPRCYCTPARRAPRRAAGRARLRGRSRPGAAAGRGTPRDGVVVALVEARERLAHRARAHQLGVLAQQSL